jgi:hypothetical protein
MRTVFVIPLMFTERDLIRINPDLPLDYKEKSSGFWAYVDEKLKTQRSVQKLYYDSLTKENIAQALEFVEKTNPKSFDVVKKFKDAGAQLLPTEDSMLLEESNSWASMLEREDYSATTQEFLAQTLMDRDKYIASTINDTLGDGETALLFLRPGRRASDFFPSQIRVIKIQPFDPSDYLNSWLVTLRLRSKNQVDSG